MYTSRRLFDRQIFTSQRKSDEAIITITVRLVGDMVAGDPHYLQFFNILMRKCYDHLNLKLVGRNYFDPDNKIVLPETKLEVWPGYVSSIRQHERDILMCVDVISKIMRLETLLDVLNQCFHENSDKFRENFCKSVIGIVVLTDYNNNTYRIEDVDFATTPSHTFDMKGEQVSYVQYYKKKYGLKISNLSQPMLVTTSKAKTREAAEPERVYLVPQFCRPTGLTDAMRENHRLMAGVAVETRLSAARRIEKLMNFNRSICRSPAIQQDLNHWDLQLDDRLLEVDGRQLPNETIWVARNRNQEGINPERGDWTKLMHNKECIFAPPLNNWTLIITDRDRSSAQNFVTALIKAARGLMFEMTAPTIYPIRDDRPGTYNQALEEILSRGVIQLVFCVVSNIRSDRYSAIKKKCCIDRPVPSQVCLYKTMTHKNIMSIATKIAIQMNCKIGGAPWFVDIPLDGMMTVGFDVCHDTTVKSKDFGAMVATLDKQMTKYYSAVSAHENGEELSNDICINICKAAQAYFERNKRLPLRIVIYRDGVGEGQIAQVMEREVHQIKKRLDELYRGPDKYRMTFIIVTKRLNTRLFCNNDNPDPGTIVDDVITSPIKYDFFLVSQKVRQGTVTPTSYNVVYDTLGLDPDKIQRLSYKLTHMYFNCSNTVRVPAPCHYAHKLAFLVSKFIHRAPDTQLQNTLYFL
ncbi:hypothetical protein PUN28_012449 [Cardiocondyla obscurior]